MNTPFDTLLAEALAFADEQEVRARAEREAFQHQERVRYEQAKDEILRDLTPLYPQLAAYADYIEVEHLSGDGTEFATGAGVLLRFPDCDLIYLCVQRLTPTSPWQTLPDKEEPFQVYPDVEEWWDGHSTSHRHLLSAIADAHRRHQHHQAKEARRAEAQDTSARAPGESELCEDYLTTLRVLECAGHPLPLGSTLSDHIKGLVRRLSQYELLLMRGPAHDRPSASH
jgi:hypothetical protein